MSFGKLLFVTIAILIILLGNYSYAHRFSAQSIHFTPNPPEPKRVGRECVYALDNGGFEFAPPPCDYDTPEPVMPTIKKCVPR